MKGQKPNSANTLLLTQQMNLKSLKRHDAAALDIIKTASHVVLYKFHASKWERMEVEGTLFLYSRQVPPLFAFIIMNRLSMSNFIGQIMPSMELQITDAYIIFKAPNEDIYGIWFFKDQERIMIGEAFEEYSKVSLPPYVNEDPMLSIMKSPSPPPQSALFLQDVLSTPDRNRMFDPVQPYMSLSRDGTNPIDYIATHYSSPLPYNHHLQQQHQQHQLIGQQNYQNHQLSSQVRSASPSISAATSFLPATSMVPSISLSSNHHIHNANSQQQHLESLFRKAAERAAADGIELDRTGGGYSSSLLRTMSPASNATAANNNTNTTTAAYGMISTPLNVTEPQSPLHMVGLGVGSLALEKSYAGIVKTPPPPPPAQNQTIASYTGTNQNTSQIPKSIGSSKRSQSPSVRKNGNGTPHKRNVSTSEAAAVLPRPFVPQHAVHEFPVKPDFVSSSLSQTSKAGNHRSIRSSKDKSGKVAIADFSSSSDSDDEEEEEEEERNGEGEDSEKNAKLNAHAHAHKRYEMLEEKEQEKDLKKSLLEKSTFVGTVVEMSRSSLLDPSEVKGIKDGSSSKGKRQPLTKAQYKKQLLRLLQKDSDLLSTLYKSYLGK